MDSLTQFLLGAGVSTAFLGPKLGWRAAVLGGVVATLPDLDSLVPYDSIVDGVTHHRGFTHSLIVQTALSPVIAAGVTRWFQRYDLSFRQVLLTIWLVFITHSLLDSLTTYGTQLFWPLEVGPPIAIPSVFIIDPLYSVLLLIGIVGFLLLSRGSIRRARVFLLMFLGLATFYLGIGFSAHMHLKAKARALPELQGMRIHVKPMPFTLLYWQVLAVNEETYMVGATRAFSRCPHLALQRFERRAHVSDLLSSVPSDIKRFEWFTDGFYTYKQTAEGLVISDLRIGHPPDFPFSFRFAAADKDQLVLHPAQRTRRAVRDFSYLQKLYRRAQTPAPACLQAP